MSEQPSAPKNRKPIYLAAGAVLVVLLIVGLYLFQPWAFFANKQVNEELPSSGVTSSSSPGSSDAPKPLLTLASGPFRSYEHETTGTASLIRLPDGSRVVRLTDFKTSNGPDVKVWLSVNPASKATSARDSKYVDLGEMKGNVGNQNYPVPADAAEETWASVVIWCDRFSVPFGAANLEPATPQLRN